MHILLIHQAFAAITEPGGTRHHEFARHLALSGFKVSIIASPVSYLTGNKISKTRVEHEANGQISIYRVYTYPALHKSFIHRVFSFISFMVSSFFQAIKIKDVDVVWGTSPPIFQVLTAYLVSKIKGARFLLEVRDLWPAFAVAVGILKNKFLIYFSLKLEKFLYKNADRIIVNSPGFISHLEEKGARNIQLLPNGSDLSLFKSIHPQRAIQKYGWGGKFILLYAGAHGMSNDLGVVIRAAKLSEVHPAIQFVLLGDGKEKPNLMEMAEEIKTSNIQFLDPVPKSEVAEIISAANACIAILKPIALYKTTYPNKVFDYMAAGKPILLAIDGVIRDVIEKANCGIFCPPGEPRAMADAAMKLFNNPKMAEQLGRNGKSYLIKNFNREKIAREFANLIKEMEDRNGRKNPDR